MLRCIKLLFFILFVVGLISNSSASYVSTNGFFYVDKDFKFEKELSSGEVCNGEVKYPQISYRDKENVMEINNRIYDFISRYRICNKGDYSNNSVIYKVLPSGEMKYFTVAWYTKDGEELKRIDTLNFDKNKGTLLQNRKIFNNLASSLVRSLINLSEGHLEEDCDWEIFEEKIEENDVQLLVEDKKWYIIFNSTKKNDKLVVKELPDYLLKNEDSKELP